MNDPNPTSLYILSQLMGKGNIIRVDPEEDDDWETENENDNDED